MAFSTLTLLIATSISVGEPDPSKNSVSAAYAGRMGAAKERLLKVNGGTEETEAAVALGLEWLAKQIKPDGRWEFDGSHKDCHVAATGMCLLPFLAAGESHLDGRKYKEVVAKGIAYLKSQLKPNGHFRRVSMYEQAIGTLALCEAYGMTGDEKLKKPATQAVEYIVKSQRATGGWDYSSPVADDDDLPDLTPGEMTGDTSILGWQVQALERARQAALPIPETTWNLAEKFLIGVSESDESRYGYRTKGSTSTLSAVGLLARININGDSKMPFVAHGVKNLWEEQKPSPDLSESYYIYHATQVFHSAGGKDWHNKWNPAIQKILLDRQITAKNKTAKESEFGSFPKDKGFIGLCCGQVGTTAMALLTLEVYYRNPPLKPRRAPEKK